MKKNPEKLSNRKLCHLCVDANVYVCVGNQTCLTSPKRHSLELDPNLFFNFHKVTCDWPQRREDPQNIFKELPKHLAVLPCRPAGLVDPNFVHAIDRSMCFSCVCDNAGTEVCLALQPFTNNFRTLPLNLSLWESSDVDWMLCGDTLAGEIFFQLCTSSWCLIQYGSCPWTRVTVWWICIMNEYLCFATQQNSFVASVMSVSLLSRLSALLPKALPAPSGASFPWLTSKSLHIPAAKSPLNKSLQNVKKMPWCLISGCTPCTLIPTWSFFTVLLTVKLTAPLHLVRIVKQLHTFLICCQSQSKEQVQI